jgi:hypothetical protein
MWLVVLAMVPLVIVLLPEAFRFGEQEENIGILKNACVDQN